MPILRIAKLGNPILRQIAPPVDPRDIRTYDLQQFIDNLIETRDRFGGAPGVAFDSTGCDGL
jgi:peptide deformylase